MQFRGRDTNMHIVLQAKDRHKALLLDVWRIRDVKCGWKQSVQMEFAFENFIDELGSAAMRL